jgi:hypothetical protein
MTLTRFSRRIRRRPRAEFVLKFAPNVLDESSFLDAITSTKRRRTY